MTEELGCTEQILSEIYEMKREIRHMRRTLSQIESRLDSITHRFGRMCGDILREFAKREMKRGGKR